MNAIGKSHNRQNNTIRSRILRVFAVLYRDSRIANGSTRKKLMSAADPGRLFDLRCEVREAMVAYLRDELPTALPRDRQEVLAGPGAGNRGADRAVASSSNMEMTHERRG